MLERFDDLLDERHGNPRPFGNIGDTVGHAFVVQGKVEQDPGRVS
jgi:hypothetical protein